MPAQFHDSGYYTFLAGAALEPHRRVKLDAAKKTVVYAGDEASIGVTTRVAALGDPVTVKLWNSPGTFLVEAAAAISLNANVNSVANGRVTGAAGIVNEGKALEAASGLGSIIEVLPIGTTS